MIRVKNSSGNEYMPLGEENIHFLTIWMKGMGTQGGIRFYDAPCDLVADFRLTDVPDEIEMVSYPHCDKKAIVEVATLKEVKIWQLIKEEMKKHPGRTTFSIDVSGEPHALVKEDFKRYFAMGVVQTEMFTFDNPDPKEGFPKVYVYEKGQGTSTYGPVFRLMAKASRTVFPPIDKPTPDGLRFTYMLYNSFSNLTFEPHVPNLGGVYFPTKKECLIPPQLNVEALEKFLVKIGIDQYHFKDGKVVKDNSLSAVVSKPVEEIIDAEDDDDLDADTPPFLLDVIADESMKEDLKEEILRQYEDKKEIKLGDAWAYGLDKLLALLPLSNKIVNIFTDMPGIARKMCIYQGVYHVVPLFFGDSKSSLCEFLDMTEEVLNICTDETFPTHSTTNPGKVS